MSEDHVVGTTRRGALIALGAGAAACSQRPEAPAYQGAVRFAHGVASGDPGQDRVVIWTRISPDVEGPAPVRWIVADDGSSQLEQAKITALVECMAIIYPAVEVMLFAERSRKGGAIYQAWDAAPEADLLAFVDADGAVDVRRAAHSSSHLSPLDVGGGAAASLSLLRSCGALA